MVDAFFVRCIIVPCLANIGEDTVFWPRDFGVVRKTIVTEVKGC
jgi:hypothetical protein